MKHTRHKTPWSTLNGALVVGIFLFSIAFLSIADAAGNRTVNAIKIDDLNISEHVLTVLGSLPLAQCQETLGRIKQLTLTERQEACAQISIRTQQQTRQDASAGRGADRARRWDGQKESTQRQDMDEGEKDKDAARRRRATTLDARLPEKPESSIIHDAFPGGLTLFGQDLFVNAPNSFVPETQIPIPLDYRLGPGDTILLQLSGKVYQQHVVMVDRAGVLTIPGLVPLPVTGMTFQQLKELLQERVQKQMLGAEIARITLGELRSLQVFVLGDVPHPGSYTVNSLTTATNAIFSSGGIKPIGSLRNIQVKRQGKTVVTLDLYTLLLEGDQSADVRLQGGDIVFVPPIGHVIAVTERVKRPGIYELASEQTVEQAINLAGGLLPDADPRRVKIERFQNRQQRILLDLDITQQAPLQTRIQPGDTIRVSSVLSTRRDVVTLDGFIDNPGEYQWHPALHLADVVRRNNLLPQVDLLYAVVTRLDKQHGRLQPLTLNLGRALDDPSSPDNLLLQPEDAIRIFGTEEDHADSVQTLVEHLRGQARYSHREQVVNVAGYVRYPGNYPFSPGMGLRDLLHAAGDIEVETDMEYTLIVRFNERGEIEPFSVRLSQLLRTDSRQSDIRLHPMDQILVFPTILTNRKARAQRSVVDADKQMINDNESGKTNNARADNNTRGARTTRRGNGNGAGDGQEATLLRRALLEPVLVKLRQQSSLKSPTKIVLINGSVRHPGEYPLEANMRVSDLVRASGRMAEPAYTLDAELSRFSIAKEKHRAIGHKDIDLEKIIAGDASANILLQPHDVLLIKRTPQWSTVNSVTFEGELRFPGTYPVKPGETLLQVLERAGGLTPYAYPKGAIFLRQSLREREKKEIDALASRLEMEVAERDLQQVDKAEEQKKVSSSSLIIGLIQKLRSTVPQGRLAIDLPLMMAHASSSDNTDAIVLRDQDHLIIPQKINEITVLGEVFYPTSHQYLRTHSIEDYINLSGGYSQMADLEHIYVVKANGQVVSNTPALNIFGSAWLSGGSGSISPTPGDTIVVPLKVERIAPMALWKDLSQILYNIAITSATLKTVGAL